MKRFIESFVNNFRSGERIYSAVVLFATIASVVGLFFVPTTTIFQICMVAIVALATLITFGVIFFSEDNNLFDLFSRLSILVWGMFIAVILWLCQVSLLWSVFPLTIAIVLIAFVDEEDMLLIKTLLIALFFSFTLGAAQDNIDAKNLLKSNPKPNVVVVSEIDLGSNVFFIKRFDKAFSFESKDALKEAYELDIKKGDTIKILRHPNYPTEVIKVTK